MGVVKLVKQVNTCVVQGFAPFSEMADAMQRCRALAHALLQMTGIDAPSMLIHVLVEMQPSGNISSGVDHSTALQGQPSSSTVNASPTASTSCVVGTQKPSTPDGSDSTLKSIAVWLRETLVNDSNRWGIDVSPTAGGICCDQVDVGAWASVPALRCFVEAMGLYGAVAVAHALEQVPSHCLLLYQWSAVTCAHACNQSTCDTWEHLQHLFSRHLRSV